MINNLQTINHNFVLLLCLHVCELLYIVSFVVKSPSGGKNPWKQHLRIQEGHFLKIALNLDLTRSNARSRREDFDCIFFMAVGAFCVELRPFYCKKRISVPMSYISCLIVALRGQKSMKNVPANPRSHANFQFFGVNHVFECLIDGFRSWEGRNRHRMDLL